ncbi:cation diffusion facilitator family transporter [Nocardioides sp.]|jgi:cobalt-zinc-cadmium efflux system protein|uniref:cation diffusion facilitator family transporter n=1 Tax=Nocardioides sp. TaxID=35761 RepID=UPI000C903F9C|nr:cation diffusion facilitator family transporter [Nocardioides sp.]MAS53398.1 cation transporter [Pimelobacter sp.]MDE0776771.1 cation diffusion facilitator family transporter [Nocardioides sp.]
MGAGHGHGHSAASAGGRHRWRLAVSFGMVATFFVVELVVGLVSGSLALISDAGHMAADVVALGSALLATKFAARPDTTGRRSYGSYRAEIFASGLTVLIMLGVSVYVVIEAVRRLGESPEIGTGPVLLVGILGLVINLVSMVLLRAGAQESLNVKGAYYEVIADAAGSVGVIVAAIMVAATSEPIWDTAIALAIGVFVALRAIVLGRQVLAVLGQHVPEGLDIEAVAQQLAALPGVADVHDLHAWTLTSGMNVATAHLVLDPDTESQTVLETAQRILRSDHAIEHATLQVENRPTRACDEVTW